MDIHSSYSLKKGQIEKRLLEFRQERSEEDVFAELVFCLLTPQSKARICDKAVKKLTEKGLLLSGSPEKIRLWLPGVRFNDAKSRYIAEARKLFHNGSGIKIKDRLHGDPKQLREWLASSVKGMGYKEASHFLRNVGIGEELAILDRHIMKNLLKNKIIEELPKSLTPKRYLEIEEKMRSFSAKTGIPMAHLDLLFWSEETGEIFK